MTAGLPPEIRTYYERGQEAERLSGAFPSGPLELVRTQELIQRHLRGERLEILDVGGGPGVYARWLAELGHDVRLIDPVSLHVEQARSVGVDATEGDARVLDQTSGSVDVVLLLGPLYHLVDRADRLQALREARRVLRPQGLVFAAGISRFAALFDVLVRLDRLYEDDVLQVVARAVATGEFQGAESGLFTTAYFHRPSELLDEARDAGLTLSDCSTSRDPDSLSRTSRSAGRIQPGGRLCSRQRGSSRRIRTCSRPPAISCWSAAGDADDLPRARLTGTVASPVHRRRPGRPIAGRPSPTDLLPVRGRRTARRSTPGCGGSASGGERRS